MKIRISRESGNALIVTLGITVVIGTALASYLKLVEVQNRSVVRSQMWNAAMPASEAGIEEALAHLNSVGDGNRATNGWEYRDGLYHLTRTIGNMKYEVSMDSSNQPAIKSVGYYNDVANETEVTRKVLVTTTKYGSGMRGIITKNGITMNGNCKIDSFDSLDPNYSTNGRYDASKSKDNGYAGSVYGNVITGGGKIYGYVGTGPNGTAEGNVGNFAWMSSSSGIQPGHYSKDLNFTFPDVATPSASGMSPAVNQTITVTNYNYLTTQITSTTYPNPVPASGVATNFQTVTTVAKPFSWSGTLTTNFAVTSSTTYPAAGTYVGNVTSRTVVTGKGKKATTTTWYDYTTITGYSYPATTYTYNTVTTNATTETRRYDYVLSDGYYRVNSLSLSGQAEFLVRGDAELYIENGFSMSGQSQITVLPNAKVKIYVGGNVSLSGNGIMNLTQDASAFAIMGLPTCTSLSLSGNAAFTGTIYAPNAALSFNGGGNNTYDCVGAVVGSTAYFNGHFNFHYDEQLGRLPVTTLYKVGYWTEL